LTKIFRRLKWKVDIFIRTKIIFNPKKIWFIVGLYHNILVKRTQRLYQVTHINYNVLFHYHKYLAENNNLRNDAHNFNYKVQLENKRLKLYWKFKMTYSSLVTNIVKGEKYFTKSRSHLLDMVKYLSMWWLKKNVVNVSTMLFGWWQRPLYCLDVG